MKEQYTVIPIPKKEAVPWLNKKHYAKRLPQMQYVFGLFKNKILIGVCTFGIPASQSLCRGVCGESNWRLVIEFNRLCLEHNNKNEGSFFLGRAFRLIDKPKVVVSYADTSQGHVGYIYQSTNWIYTGLSEKFMEPKLISGENKHNRHLWGLDKSLIKMVERPRKHRYIYFHGSHKQVKEMKRALKYPILPYPKGESKRYDSGGKVQTQGQLFL